IRNQGPHQRLYLLHPQQGFLTKNKLFKDGVGAQCFTNPAYTFSVGGIICSIYPQLLEFLVETKCVCQLYNFIIVYSRHF
ncbi:hypothetical protein KC19_2G117100, partial [Ceratodon purpureus]